jgi:type I restriction enzyme S subunit
MIEEFEIPLPATSEQISVISRVDELMALCDRLEAQQKEREARHTALNRASIARFDDAPTPANLNFLFHPSYSVTPADLRKSILSLAVQGKIAYQDPDEESGAPLLQKIVRDSSKQRFAKVQSITRDDSTAVPFKLPLGWSVARLGSILQPTRGISYGVIKLGPEPQNGGVNILRCSNVRFRRLDLNGMRKVTHELSEEYGRTILRGGEVLINVRGTLGGCALVPFSLKGFNIAREVAVVPVHSEMNAAFLLNVVASPYFQDKVNGNLRGIAYEGLNLGLLRDFLIPIPPFAEQCRIVAKVDQLMGLVDQLEAQLAASETTAKELLDAVVHELLHSTADVVEFPRSESDRSSQRAAIGCYAIEYLARNPSFGRTMLMKACYLSETHLGLPFGWQPMRQAAGPWDPWIEDFESLGTRSDWFTVSEKALNNGHSKIEYSPKKALNAKAAEAISVLGNQKAEFDRLLNLLADRSTEEAEIIATLFAAWNDFLIDGKTPTDDEIIHEVRENWHDSKGRFSPALLKRWLDWMRSHFLTPKGHGPRTTQQLKLALS